MKLFTLFICITFGLLLNCSSSEEDKAAETPPSNSSKEEQENTTSSPPEPNQNTQETLLSAEPSQNAPEASSQPQNDDTHKPPAKDMFTIFHAADDSEDVYINLGLKGFALLPGECLLLADYDFSSLMVQLGAGFGEGAWNIGRGSIIACQYYQDDNICRPDHYLIKNRGDLFDNYVMEPQKSAYQDLSSCVYIGDKIK